MAGEKRLVAVTLDEASIGHGGADQEHEREVAIYDLIEANSFSPEGDAGGPYALHVSLLDAKLALGVRSEAGEPIVTHVLSLSPFRRVIKDYFLVCDSYYAAVGTASAAQIEAIDRDRRGLHDEAATLLQERLRGKITIDHGTARRLFTLITALHWKG